MRDINPLCDRVRRVGFLALLLGQMACAASVPADALHLGWEWNRAPDHRALVVVKHLAAEGGGVLGIKRSPSLADALPDAQVLTGTLFASASERPGRTVVVRLPKAELPANAAVWAVVALGYTQDGAAVCIAVPPKGETAEAQAAWLAKWRCGK